MTQEEENMPFDRSAPNPFGLPEGYFQQSASSVLNRIEWLEEHKAFPRLSVLRQQAFGFPEHYFEGSAQRLELLETPVLWSLKKQQPFSVPAGYFESLELAGLTAITGEEENVLAAIPKRNAFAIADTYFTENETKLKQMLSKQPQPARVISLFGPKVRMAAAAMLVAVLGLWIYRMNTPAPAELKDCGTIACLDKMDLLKSKHLDNLETDDLYDLVNSKDLEKKLSGQEGTVQPKSADSIDDDLMDELPDEI